MKTIELKVKGMMCVHCEKHIAEAIEKVAGVEKAIADHDNDRVLVRLAGDSVDEAALKAAVEGEEKEYCGIVTK
ncbi:MAG: cation transporter [Sphaerochaetaceae bacterium]|nr:cation transporter [Sphaerochaetaceae bacterium]